ncbi:MAG: pyridoxamine 5'-phosphate oxidase family protein [Anaerolineales bacterium]|jgi:PPOX class probable F420-dependent enzyme
MKKTASLPPRVLDRLKEQRNIWLASVRPDGRPHLVPIWFAWDEGRIYLCIEPGSVKALNLMQNPLVSLALEDGSSPVICEGRATVIPDPWPSEVLKIFVHKYDWDITTETRYTQLVQVTPSKWLHW